MYNGYNIGTDLISEANEYIQNNTRVNFNMFYRGIVVSVNDPMKLGRAKIRVPSIHGVNSHNENFIPDSALPWATPAVWINAGHDMGVFNPPTPGNRVFLTFEAGDSEHPIYFGGIPTKIGNTKYYKPPVGVLLGAEQQINTDDYITDLVTGTESVIYKSFKGATIIVDDFDGKEYIRIIDQSGQTFTMGNDGDILPRRGNKLGTSSESYIELNNNRGEKIRIEDGKIITSGREIHINNDKVYIPNYEGGGGGGGGTVDAYTKAETDALLANKSRVFFAEPTVPYQKDDIWYNGTTVYRCVNTRKNGSFSINDWQIDTSFMTPEQVTRTITETETRILETVSSTYVTPAYVDSKLNYEVLIYSSQGNIFKNDLIETTLTAYIRSGNKDISAQFNDNQFVWSRASDNPEEDILWNRQHISGSRSIRITGDDVQSKATFTVELVDEINVVNYIKSGLIEIFDGYDEPTSTGEWMSMIRTNAAIIPNNGITYDALKHGYKFSGDQNALALQKPISIIPGYTYEFVTELPSYIEIQNILSSNEDTNNGINNRIACAVAGHLQMRKHGYTLNAGNVMLNRKTYLSIRYADEDNIEVYYNGDYAGRYVQSGWTSEPADLTRIGKWCNGIIHSIRVYNRLLTPSEILTNYNEDIARFSN